MKTFFKLICSLALLLMLMSTVLMAQGVSIDLGKTTQGRYMKLVGNSGTGLIQDVIKIRGEYCAKNAAAGNAMYFDVLDEYFKNLPAGTYSLINVEYYDSVAATIGLQYSAQTGATTHPDVITTAATGKWKAFSFFVNDAYFGNNLANASDIKLTCTGTMFINAVKVIPFEKYIDFGKIKNADGTITDDAIGFNRVNLTGSDGLMRYVDTLGMTLMTSNRSDPTRGGYVYLNLDDAYINGSTAPWSNVFVTMEYFDGTDPNKYLRLQYDSQGSDKNKSTESIFGKAWQCLRTYTFEINDAFFANLGAGTGDMRLQFAQPGLFLNRITITKIPKRPLPSTVRIGNQTSFKFLDKPTVDGNVSDWSWLASRRDTMQMRYDANNYRTDEFYRTWILNNDNVPVVEAGEAGGVVNPGVPGAWDPKDLTGMVRVGWDDDNVYFAVEVKDNVLDVTGSSWDQKDGFGFYFDVSHTVVNNRPAAIRDDNVFQKGEHFIFLPASNSDLGVWKHSTSQTGEALPTTVKKSVVPTADGYILEASIPISMLTDGLPWRPDSLNHPDNYSPLYGYILNDADNVGPTSGRLMYGAHNDDDEFWGTLGFVPIPLVDKGVMVDLGPANYESFMTQVEKTSTDGAVKQLEVQGKKCVQLEKGYAYFDVNDAVLSAAKPHSRLLISVEYLDSGAVAGGRFRIQYNSSDASLAGVAADYKDTPWITVGNTKQWKTAIIKINDAKFAGKQNGKADFRVHSESNNLVLNQVRVAVMDLWIDLGDQSNFNIASALLSGDGVRDSAFVGGFRCQTNLGTANYMYFAVADSAIYNGNHQELFLTIEYYDTAATASIGVHYNSFTDAYADPSAAAFSMGTNQWKLHTFYIPDGKFANLGNGSSDFRTNKLGGQKNFIRRIMIGAIDALLPKTTAVEDQSWLPFVFDLQQNYPNPFNPATTIRYSLPKEGPATLKVFNVLGQEVATLVNTVQRAGVHSVQWNASQMSSGVYFCRLTQDDNMKVQKLMLMK